MHHTLVCIASILQYLAKHQYGSRTFSNTILGAFIKRSCHGFLTHAISELSHFINRHSDNPKYLKVWGNGATFDNVILRGAYERAGQVCPWQFWNDHDVRTIVTLGRVVGFDPKRDMPFDGVAHNALADARHQAKYVSAIWQKLIPTTSNS